MLAIETSQLRKEFGSQTAVSDLTLQVKPGEVFGFLGPNGAGKTTSIKMLLSLVAPTSGEGSLLSRPIGDTLVREKIGYLPEHFRFHTWLKAWEFLDFHGKMFRMEKSKRQRVIPELLELVGLSENTHAKLGTFSKGMTQRIGLAQALMNDPKLVFLDEPTSGLDPLGRKLVRDIIDGLRNAGTAVFLNSHLLSEIEQTCDRVSFIRKGVVLETNSMATLAQERLRVVLRVADPSLDLLDALKQIGDFVVLDELTPFDAETGRIVFHVPAENDIPAVAKFLVESGQQIIELRPQRITLEERFLQVIRGDELGNNKEGAA
ncbi:MAG: ABC-2 type transport system ATP-binding protein [Cellvibrionaceae bacterium]|jgi:ABC-2 type transport system ATP-binding protein